MDLTSKLTAVTVREYKLPVKLEKLSPISIKDHAKVGVKIEGLLEISRIYVYKLYNSFR